MPNHIEWAVANPDSAYALSPGAIAELTESENLYWGLAIDTGSSTMVVEGPKAKLVALGQRLLELANSIEPGYTAIVNIPGYLPTDDPVWFSTQKDAWDHLRNDRMVELERADVDPDTDAAFAHLRSLSEGLLWDELGDAEHRGTGSITSTTPGYEGEHDQGVAYSVTVQE